MLGYDFNHKLHRCERGVVMVFYAILLPVLFGFMGLSLDAGLAYVEKGKAQDIADAAALAGAAHLSDSNRDDAIKAAVKAYVEANGIALQDDDLLKKESNSWETKESVPSGRQAVVAYGVVAVNNSEGTPVDRVRVRITKRVPVVFLSMVDGIADNIVVSAKAAAEGGGEEKQVLPIVDSGLPAISAYEGSVQFYNTNIWSNTGKGLYNDLYCLGGFNFIDKNKIMLYGDYYASSQNDNIQMKNGGVFKDVAADQHEWEEQELREDVAKTNELVKGKYEEYSKKVSNINVDSFKNGEDNKRYIDVNTGTVDSPVEEGEFIDLYIDGKNMNSRDGITPNGWNNVLTNDYLHGIKNIRNLYLKNVTVLDINNMTIGNVIGLDGDVSIAGNNNHFVGDIFANNNVYIGGNDNWFTSLLSHNIYIGYARNPDSFNCDLIQYSNSWKCYFYKKNQGPDGDSGPDSGESGSSGEGSSTTGKLRLVE